MLKGFEKEVTTLRFGKQRNKGEKNVVSGKNRCDNDDSRYLRKDVKKKKRGIGVKEGRIVQQWERLDRRGIEIRQRRKREYLDLTDITSII